MAFSIYRQIHLMHLSSFSRPLYTLTMAFKLTREADKRWQRLHGYRLLDHVIAGAVFVDGERKNAA